METKQALGSFLKARRQQVKPADVGLPEGIRRRTPGLRREEVAMLAGVGATWYTWLEQGRDISVSPQVLSGIARALRLNSEETKHVFELAHLLSPHKENLPEAVLPTNVLSLIDASPYPAFVTNYKTEVIAYNGYAKAVYADFAALAKQDQTTLHFMFINPRSRIILPDWEDQAQTAVALFRSTTVQFVEEPWFKEQVAYLQQHSAEFANYWKRHGIVATHETTKRLQIPDIGTINLDVTNFAIQGTPGVTLTIQSPSDNQSAALLRLFKFEKMT